jgi:hypothetical protein
MEMAVHLTLHPIEQSQLILNHRQSLAFVLDPSIEMEKLRHEDIAVFKCPPSAHRAYS